MSASAPTAGGADAAITAAAARGTASGVRIAVAARGTTSALGVHGLVLQVAGTGALASVGGRVGIRVDYRGFAGAYGGGYGSRLRLAVLPACALTTPALAQCRHAVPIPAVNDGKGTLTGTVTLQASPAGQPVPGGGGAAPAVTAGRAVVLTVESGPSGSGGSYAATPLNPAGTWAVQDGAFSSTYPITVPQSVVGSAPSVALSYDSQSVDGETSAANTQGGWIGDGWSYSPGSITRSYQSCGQDTSADPATGGDECWGGYNATLSLAGHSSRLVLDGGSGNTYHLAGDDGTTVQLLTGASNGLWNGEYWLVTTTNGTKYYFGYNHLPTGSGSDTATSSAWGEPVYCPGSSDPCYSSSTGTDSWQTLGWQWSLDFVVTPQGALTEYMYQSESNYYMRGNGSGGGTLTEYTRGGFPVAVKYGWLLADAVKGAGPQAEVQFTSVPRCASDATATPPASSGSTVMCALPSSSSSATDYPDVPLDEICASSGTCSNNSPTFFTAFMLTGIQTEATTGTSPPSPQPVDSWQVGQQFDTGTGSGAQAVLAVTFLQRTGQDATATGSAVTLPAETFTSEEIDNQVPELGSGSGYPPLDRPRLETIDTEAGASVAITYASPACKQGANGVAQVASTGATITESANTSPCFPAYWSGTGIYPDWFNKSLVTKVVTADLTGTGVPNQVTNYAYLGGAAWHLDESPTASNQYRTWDEFRGYTQVEITTGQSPDPVTEVIDTYLRGMDGDPTSRDGSSPASVTVSYPSAGPDSGSTPVTDSDWLAGQVLESDTYTQAGGTADNAVINSWPTAWSQTASQSQVSTQPSPTTGQPVANSMPPLTAHMTTSSASDTRELVITPGGTATSWTDNTVTDYYDSDARLAAADHSATGLAETCTTTSYATPPSGNTMMEAYPDQVTTVTGGYASGKCPAASASDLVSDAVYYYDSPGTSLSSMIAATPGSLSASGGLQTGIKKAVQWPSGGNEQWQGISLVETSDSYGRAIAVLNGNSHLTSTTYTPAYAAGKTGALAQTVAVKDPLGYITTTTFDQERGLPIQSSDINSEVTSEAYDQLGRLLSVTLPADQGLGASYQYSYSVTGTAPPAVTSQTLQESGYSTDVIIYDGMLQQLQTRSTPLNNQAGSIDTWQAYNSDGWVTESDSAYADATGSASATLVTPVTGSLTDRVLNTYDGQGRVTASGTYSGTTLVAQSTSAYPGMNETDVTPASGGTASTVIVNALGQEVQSWAYNGSAAPDRNSSHADITTYAYTPAGQTYTIADHAGNTWQYGYDLLGEKTSGTDPGSTGKYGPSGNEGESTFGYDGDGNLTSTTNPAGQQLSYSYDALDRKTAEYSGTTSGTKLAAWNYDTAPLSGSSGSSTVARGRLAETDSYNGSAVYKETVAGYNAAYGPLGQTTSFPINGSMPAASFGTSDVYSTLTSQLESTTYTNDGGTHGLPKETVGYQYNPLGLLTGFGSGTSYLDSTSYDATGQLQSATFGPSGSQLLQQYTFDQTYSSRLDYMDTSLQPDKGPQDIWSWTYNAAGDVTSSLDQNYAGTTTATNQLQCYSYDSLQELTSAWTDSGAQTPTPPTLGSSGGGSVTTGTLTPGNVGGCANTAPAAANNKGLAPYWNDYAYDPLGSRTTQTSHSITTSGGTTTDTKTTQSQAYPGSDGASAAVQPAAATAQTTTGPGGSVTITPKYDANGATITRAVSTTGIITSGVSGTLCLDDAGSAATAGTKIDIATCSTSAAGQQWSTAPLSTTPGTGTTFLKVNGNCADVKGDATASGTVILLEPCSSSTKGELWAAQANGQWVNPNSGLCLTDPSGSTTAGTQAQITACSSSLSKGQSWATAAGTTATPYPGSLQGISYTPTGLVSQVKQSSGTTTQTISYLYDAGGGLLVQEDPTSVTYYPDAGAEQISYTTAGVVSSATRFYGESPDGTTVVRTVNGITSSGSTSAVCYEVSDPQHTGTEAINAATLAVIRRYYDPYGNQLATTATTSNPWPDNKAFLGKVQDVPTQLDLLGARQYSPATGSFLSLDPVLESGSPQQMGGYTYAGNNPVTSADPSGLQGSGSSPPPICNTAPTAAPDICANANLNTTPSGSGGTPDPSPNGAGPSGSSPPTAPTPTVAVPSPASNLPVMPISCIGKNCPNPYSVIEAISGYSDALGCFAHAQFWACVRTALNVIPFAGKGISVLADSGEAAISISRADSAYESVAQGGWAIKGIQPRGFFFEGAYRMTYAMYKGMDVLPAGFPAFDFFDPADREAISFKSADLVNSYPNGRGLLTQLNKYIRAADKFTTTTRLDYTLRADRILYKSLVVAVPYYIQPGQWDAMYAAWENGRQVGVDVQYLQVAGLWSVRLPLTLEATTWWSRAGGRRETGTRCSCWATGRSAPRSRLTTPPWAACSARRSGGVSSACRCRTCTTTRRGRSGSLGCTSWARSAARGPTRAPVGTSP